MIVQLLCIKPNQFNSDKFVDKCAIFAERLFPSKHYLDEPEPR